MLLKLFDQEEDKRFLSRLFMDIQHYLKRTHAHTFAIKNPNSNNKLLYGKHTQRLTIRLNTA